MNSRSFFLGGGTILFVERKGTGKMKRKKGVCGLYLGLIQTAQSLQEITQVAANAIEVLEEKEEELLIIILSFSLQLSIEKKAVSAMSAKARS